ncbi:MAG: hypothetical protein NDF54_09105 [archaeon GB-1867-035]|nr:hypothetical protein [Candidatus Culexmicrobium profundum]
MSGDISKGDLVKVYPHGVDVRVKKILLEGEVESAGEPKSIGLVFNGDFNFHRGAVVCKGKSLLPSGRLMP